MRAMALFPLLRGIYILARLPATTNSSLARLPASITLCCRAAVRSNSLLPLIKELEPHAHAHLHVHVHVTVYVRMYMYTCNYVYICMNIRTYQLIAILLHISRNGRMLAGRLTMAIRPSILLQEVCWGSMLARWPTAYFRLRK